LSCRDLNAAPVSIFSGIEKKPFGGTKGTFLRIQAEKPGVLVVCDVEIDYQTVDENMEALIDAKLQECQVFQNGCFANFEGPLNYENKVNCLSLFGMNKTADYCLR
jgi:hypothetical protein